MTQVGGVTLTLHPTLNTTNHEICPVEMTETWAAPFTPDHSF